MKNLFVNFFLLFCFFNVFSQEKSLFDKLKDYKGYPLEDVQYYYISSKGPFSSLSGLSGDETAIYSTVKAFSCDKSYYDDHIKNLTEDLKSQWDDHLGDKKHPSLQTYVHYFKSAREAKIKHRKELNIGNTALDYTFQYYCLE